MKNSSIYLLLATIVVFVVLTGPWTRVEPLAVGLALIAYFVGCAIVWAIREQKP